MKTKTKEELNLQLVQSTIDSLEETLMLSPFFCTLSKEDIEDIENRILNPIPIENVSNRRH